MEHDSRYGAELVLFLLSFPLLAGSFLGLGASIGVAPATLHSAGLLLAGMGIGVAFRKLSTDDDTAVRDDRFGVEWILFLVGLALVGNSVLGIAVFANVGVSVFGDAGRLLLGVSAGVMMRKLSEPDPATVRDPSRDG